MFYSCLGGRVVKVTIFYILPYMQSWPCFTDDLKVVDLNLGGGWEAFLLPEHYYEQCDFNIPNRSWYSPPSYEMGNY